MGVMEVVIDGYGQTTPGGTYDPEVIRPKQGTENHVGQNSTAEEPPVLRPRIITGDQWRQEMTVDTAAAWGTAAVMSMKM